jgi:hypothetical protein
MDSYKSFLWICVFVGFLMLCACDEYKISGDVYHDDRSLDDLYAKAQDTLQVRSQHYVIGPQLWRDFFPGALPKAHPMTAYISLRETDSTVFNEDLRIVKLYVIRENTIWKSTPVVSENGSYYKFEKLYVSRNGPEWDTGLLTDVIAEIEDAGRKESYFLISRNCQIEKIE